MQIPIVIFALLTVAGAWAGWRRSPLYSHKITFQLVGAFLLIVGVMVGGTLAVFSAPMANYPTAQAILIGLLIFGVGIGATAGIIRITDSHVAKLPPSVRIVTSERHRIQRWIWRIVAYLLISGAAILVLPSGWSWLPGVPGLLVLVGAGPSMVALYMRARRLDLGMSQTLAAPWVRWQYTDAEWEAWARNQLEWDRGQPVIFPGKNQGWKLLKAVAIILLSFLAGAFLMVSGNASDKLLAAGVCMGFCVLMGLAFYLPTIGASTRRYRKRLAAPREAVFGDEGMYQEGAFVPWILSGYYLVEATAQHHPPARMEFVFRSFNGSRSMLVTRRVPIPAGREADVAVIGRKLAVLCPNAAVRLG